MSHFKLCLFFLISLTACNGGTSSSIEPSLSPIQEITVNLATPYISNDKKNEFFTNLNAYAESKKESLRYHFTFSPSTEEESNVVYKLISFEQLETNIKELPSSIKNELKEIDYIQCVKDFINDTNNEFNVIPFDIDYLLLKYDSALYSKEDIKSMEAINEALNRYNEATIKINTLYNFGFLIDNELINIKDSDKLQEDNVTPLWCLPQYEEYFEELRTKLFSFDKIDRTGNLRLDYSLGDMKAYFREDGDKDVAFLPSIKLFNKDITPYSSYSFLYGFYFKNNINLDDEAYNALYHLLMNKEGNTSISLKDSIINEVYQTESKYDSLKDGINSSLFIQYGQIKEYLPIVILLDYLYTNTSRYSSFSECYASNFIY